MNMIEYELWKLKNRREKLLLATSAIQGWIENDKILSIEFTINRQWGNDEDPLVIDYCVELSDGGNISDLNFDTIEEALLDISKEIHEREHQDAQK